MMFEINPFRWSNCLAEFTDAYAPSWPSAPTRTERTRSVWLRRNEDLPFYCRPVSLFVLVWLMMLCALSVRISYDSYPEMGLPIFLFVLSFLALLAGSGMTSVLLPSRIDQEVHPDEYVLDVRRLRRLNWLFALVAIGIMVLNLKLDGLPPAFGFFSFDTSNYLEYGRLKQLLFPLLISIVVNSSLDPSRFWKVHVGGFWASVAIFVCDTRRDLSRIIAGVFRFFPYVQGEQKKADCEWRPADSGPSRASEPGRQ